jgi:hypothetical protein
MHPPCLSEMIDHLAICRLAANAELPDWAKEGSFYSLTRTDEELSVVCSQAHVPAGVVCEKGWRCLKVEGPLHFGLIGILASIAESLAEARISIFALGTYDTDYILVKEGQYEEAIRVLSASGHKINRLAISDQSNG